MENICMGLLVAGDDAAILPAISICDTRITRVVFDNDAHIHLSIGRHSGKKIKTGWKPAIFLQGLVLTRGCPRTDNMTCYNSNIWDRNSLFLWTNTFPNIVYHTVKFPFSHMSTLLDKLNQISPTCTELWETFRIRMANLFSLLCHRCTGSWATISWQDPFPHPLVNWPIYNACQYTANRKRCISWINETSSSSLLCARSSDSFHLNRYFEDNQLTGPIPSSISALNTLQHLSVH